MFENLGSDDLITCPRCGDCDAFVGELCLGCKEELAASWDGEKSWQAAWELEKDETLKEIMRTNPNYVYRQLDEFERLGREYADYPEFSAAIAADKATFEKRWARVDKALHASS